MIALEYVRHGTTHFGVLFRDLHSGSMIEAGLRAKPNASSSSSKGYCLRASASNVFSRLGQDLPVDARLFFYEFIRPHQQVMFKLQTANIELERFELPLQLLSFR